MPRPTRIFFVHVKLQLVIEKFACNVLHFLFFIIKEQAFVLCFLTCNICQCAIKLISISEARQAYTCAVYALSLMIISYTLLIVDSICLALCTTPDQCM